MHYSFRNNQRKQLQEYLKLQDSVGIQNQLIQQAQEEAATTQTQPSETSTSSSNESSQSVDLSRVELPEDHPLVKAFNATKSKLKDLETNFKDVDPVKYKQFQQLASEVEARKNQEQKTKLEQEQQYAALADLRVKEVESKYRQELETLRNQLEQLTGERDTYKTSSETIQNQLLNFQKERTLRQLLSDAKFDFSDEDNYTLFTVKYGDLFEQTDKGFRAKKDGKNVDPNTLIQDLKQANPKFWIGTTPTGSDASPGNITPVNNAGNPGSIGKVVRLPSSMKNATAGDLVKYGIDRKDYTKLILEGKVEFYDE